MMRVHPRRRALVTLTLAVVLAGCATWARMDPALRVAQTFDAFLTQVNETTDFYDRLYRERLLSQAEYDRFADARAAAQPTVDALYAAYRAGEAVDTREDFRRVRRDLEVYILKMLAAQEATR